MLAYQEVIRPNLGSRVKIHQDLPVAHQGAGKWGSPAATDLEEEWSQQVDRALAKDLKESIYPLVIKRLHNYGKSP